MAQRIVEGIDTGGHVELAEPPQGVAEGARVRVVFPDAEPADAEDRARLREEAFAQMERGFDFGGSQPEMADVPDDPAAREARRQASFARMRHGIDLGGPPYPTREEIYDERGRELDRRRGG